MSELVPQVEATQRALRLAATDPRGFAVAPWWNVPVPKHAGLNLLFVVADAEGTLGTLDVTIPNAGQVDVPAVEQVLVERGSRFPVASRVADVVAAGKQVVQVDERGRPASHR